MSEREESPDVQPSPAPGRQRGDVWAVVLAGGQGVRLRPLARRVRGDDRPKQYVPLLGAHSLLEQTLDRVTVGVELLLHRGGGGSPHGRASNRCRPTRGECATRTWTT